jgi:hypothetical protein
MNRDKTMRSLVRTNALLGLMLIALAMTSYIFANNKFIPESRPAVTQTIAEIQDIEHLRKVALLLVRNNDERVSDTNQVFVSGIKAFGWFCLMCAVFFIANALTVHKHIRAAKDRGSISLPQL